jgi:hypothetical protein
MRVEWVSVRAGMYLLMVFIDLVYALNVSIHCGGIMDGYVRDCGDFVGI